MTTHIQDADHSSIWPTLRRNSIPTVWVELSIRRGLMPKFCRINPSFLNISEVQITCDATLQHLHNSGSVTWTGVTVATVITLACCCHYFSYCRPQSRHQCSLRWFRLSSRD